MRRLLALVYGIGVAVLGWSLCAAAQRADEAGE